MIITLTTEAGGDHVNFDEDIGNEQQLQEKMCAMLNASSKTKFNKWTVACANLAVSEEVVVEFVAKWRGPYIDVTRTTTYVEQDGKFIPG